jgi:3',5'-cyclic AMP phosphodiesterase CpdA
VLLAHFSDPHLTSLMSVRPLSLINKRLLGYLSWRRRRRHIHSAQILEALLADLAAVAPDHLVVTGDLTHLGLPDEFDQAARWLARLGSPHRVTIVPGNHDAYIAAPWSQTFAKWAPYLGAEENRSVVHYPSLRVRGRLALIGLSSACPSPPFFAVGSLGREQLNRLEALLEQTARQGLLRIILIHHPPVAGSVAWRKRLTDAALLAQVLARQGADLILHGHAHYSLTRELVVGPWRIPVCGVPSVSANLADVRRAAAYHLYHFEPQAEGWDLRLDVRRYSGAREGFSPVEERRLWLPGVGR